MGKQVFYADEAREKVLAGAKILRDAVATTMGPKGRNVVIAKSYGGPTVTHDGVTVAENMELPDEMAGEKVGANLIREAAKKMNKVQGDGTTTVTVLTYEILREANKLITAGYNPMVLRAEIEDASREILANLDKNTISISDNQKKIAEVAGISAGDAKLGELISEVFAKISSDGIVTVEEGQGLETNSEITEGFTIERGYISAYMTNDTTRMEAVMNNPAILVTDRKIGNVNEFLPILEQLSANGKKDLVIIAEEVEGEALGVLILNKLKGVFNTVAIKAPSFGDRRKDVFEDIAVLTGATVISADAGMNFDNVSLEVLGSARKVIVSKDTTTIIEGAGSPDKISTRIQQLREISRTTASKFDAEQLDKRAGDLSGKVAVIKVGGSTETEINEKKFRIDDAVAATKAALAGGIVAGGGITPITLSRNLKSNTAGAEILRAALKKPFLQITENAGLNSAALLEKVENAKPNFGINVMSDKNDLVDLIKEGVVDPANVTREAIETAVSIASTAMTMGAVIVEIPDAKNANPELGGGMY